MSVNSLSTHSILVSLLMLLAGSQKQFDIFLLLQHKTKKFAINKEGLICKFETDRGISLDHGLDPGGALDGAWADGFGTAFAEKTSHGRLVGQAELASILERQEYFNEDIFLK